ncbi:MAG: hypothetical protein KatS3mg027_0732 [Bacteroidia bacterium]|nr:MAG: hypothetical protein KatS3mg027_0732 [Bacteroidia bacterium]
MIESEVISIKRLSQISLLRTISFTALAFLVVLFYFYPIDTNSSFVILLLFVVIYTMINIKYFQEQKRVWQHLPRFRFISWYFISFSIIGIVVLIAFAIISYVLFDNYSLMFVAGSLGIIEIWNLYWIYSKRLHFIAVKPNHIMIAKKRIQFIFPEKVSEIHYRNDILIFKLSNDNTIFINFLEIENPQDLKIQLADWLDRYLPENKSIIEELRVSSN